MKLNKNEVHNDNDIFVPSVLFIFSAKIQIKTLHSILRCNEYGMDINNRYKMPTYYITTFSKYTNEIHSTL